MKEIKPRLIENKKWGRRYQTRKLQFFIFIIYPFNRVIHYNGNFVTPD